MCVKFWAPLLLSLLLAVPLAGQEPWATLQGESIHQADVPISPDQRKLEQQLYELRMQSLGQLIATRLLADEAAKQDQTVDEFVDARIRPRIGVPTNKEVSSYYETQKEKIGKPLKEVRDQIVALLQREKAQVHLAELVTQLRAAADLEIHLGPPRLPVSLDGVRSRGPEDAPVTIVEYSDFQCPFCRRVQPTLEELRQKYEGKIRWVFKDLPLSEIHPEAMRAAQAARCAGEQGKFWEYRAKLFEQELFTDAMYETVADELKLKSDPLMECLDSGKHEEAVLAEAREAAGFGVGGTPAILVNGILSSGARPLEFYDSLIRRELSLQDDAAE